MQFHVTVVWSLCEEMLYLCCACLSDTWWLQRHLMLLSGMRPLRLGWSYHAVYCTFADGVLNDVWVGRW